MQGIKLLETLRKKYLLVEIDNIDRLCVKDVERPAAIPAIVWQLL
jgi:hypothetical protein